MRSLILAAGFVMALLTNPVCAQAPPAAPKFGPGLSWVNEDGSVFSVTGVAPNGLITGTFTTTGGCGANKPHPVTGWYFAAAAGGALAFAVNWEGCSSVTTWSGQYNNATGAFRTLWHLAFAAAPAWNGTVSGSHTFVLQPAKKP